MGTTTTAREGGGQLVSMIKFDKSEKRATVFYRHALPLPPPPPPPQRQTSPYFLFVEYSHPRMAATSTSRIEIRIEPEAYAVGNEILSRIFVLRFLTSFQSAPFVFSEEYVLKIVNDEIEEFEIGWHDFILLKDKSYEVKPLISVAGCCFSQASRS